MLAVIGTAVLVGVVVGVVGRVALPGRRDVSVALTILVGVLAALGATALARAAGRPVGTGPDAVETALQVALAAVAVVLVTGWRGRDRRS